MSKSNDWQLTRHLEEIYRDVTPTLSFRDKFTTIYRPLYAPVFEIMAYIDSHSSVLDIGCGTGGILFLLQKECRLQHGCGTDINEKAIQIARRTNRAPNLEFETGTFDQLNRMTLKTYNTFLCFDVFHHIRQREQAHFLDSLVAAMKENDLLIVKDLDKDPWYKSVANTITDFISSRSFVSYESMPELVDYFRDNGLTVLTAKRLDSWIWSHFLIVVQKRPAPSLNS